MSEEVKKAEVVILRPIRKYSDTVITIKKSSLWTIIYSTLILACISIIDVWFVLEEDTIGKVFWTFIVVALVAGFVSVLAPLLDRTGDR